MTSARTERTRSRAVLPFKHPLTAICCGSTVSGKTLFVLRLVENMETMIEPPPKSTVYYMEYQPVFDEYPQKISVRACPPFANWKRLATL